jgi:NAD(P)-dependent dehydrogenase (short-subunit alcohol dehydrogenase family)
MATKVANEINNNGGEAEAYKLDVTNLLETQSVMEKASTRFGSVDVAFCNAGIREIKSALELDLDDWKKVIDVNVNGVFITAQTFAKMCVKNKKPGNIVITASTLGISAANSRCAYTTSKHATVGLTKQLAIDLAQFNIRVNAVGPGVIKTPLTERYFQDKEVLERIKNIHAMKRVGNPSEVSNAVMFLASEESSFCTGSVLMVDGGWTAGKIM